MKSDKQVKCSKTTKVLEHLQKNGSITSWEAINEYGATRLSAIIYNLREKYRIESCSQICTDRFGNQSTFAKYIYCGAR